MSERDAIFVVIPAFNEASRIEGVLSDLQTHGFQNIVIVNDGSSDDTSQRAKRAGAIVINHLINRGQGAALATGIHFVATQYAPRVIVTFDADGQHQASDIPALTEPIFSGSADIVLGSRFLALSPTMPLTRKFVLKMGILFTNFISRIRLTDTHNGLRALNRQAYTAIEIRHRGMEHASEIIDEINKKKLRYTERPVHILYTNYSLEKGQSSLDFIKLGCKILMRKLI